MQQGLVVGKRQAAPELFDDRPVQHHGAVMPGRVRVEDALQDRPAGLATEHLAALEVTHQQVAAPHHHQRADVQPRQVGQRADHQFQWHGRDRRFAAQRQGMTETPLGDPLEERA